MKKILYIFLLLSIFKTACSQDVIYVQGTVSSENTGLPVENYPVFITTDDSSYFNMVFTDVNGFFVDTVPSIFSGGIFVFTYDCNGEEHYEYIQEPDSSNFVYFEICTDSCDITADFTYDIDSADFYLVHFTDLSTGNNITEWYWDFDDGSFSTEKNPSHHYSYPGTYFVSLIVSDSTGFCYDQAFQPVSVGDTAWGCRADFSVELDSINNTPNVYYFTDKSEGNIVSWEWDFGDGTWSHEQSPVHVYSDSGMYYVCLTVSSEYGNNYCRDTYCMFVNTPEYYNFGGQVFAGGYPLNVEENDSSNRATAFLYRRYKNLWRLVDQREFWRYGYYWFVNKLEGDYIIKIELKEGSPLFNEYAPGYYGDEIFWQNSNLFNLQNSEVFDVNINLQQFSFLQIGTGRVSGVIYADDSCAIFDKSHIPVYLFSNDKLAMVKYTDDNGFFEFGDLPYGNYKLNAEITGMYSDKLNFTIDAQHQNIDSLGISLSCSNPDFIFSYNENPSLKIENIFPVPADKSFTVELLSENNMRITFSLYDITGKKIKTVKKSISAGKNSLVFSTEKIPGGLYMIRVGENNGNGFASEKIIIKH